ncbi:hypothetical protein ACQP1W_39860 [Spirillospora sp. CA-255316]
MSDWWSIEVFDAEFPASSWRYSWGDALIESALTYGADHWEWHEHRWGLVFEVSFADEEAWRLWRELPGTRAALDAVPDPVNGLHVYRGRGGSSGSPVPRRPRPAPGAAAVDLEPPAEERRYDLRHAGTEPPPGELSPVAPGVPAPPAAPPLAVTPEAVPRG